MPGVTWWRSSKRTSWAYTARPDLWGPGSLVTVNGATVGHWVAEWGLTSDMVYMGPHANAAESYTEPGAVEALVAVGRIKVDAPARGLWVESDSPWGGP